MIFVAFLIAENGDGVGQWVDASAAGLQEIIAIGTTTDEAVDLVMDAWHAYAEHHHLDPDSAHPEDVAVLSGAVGDAWVNGDKQ